MKEPYTHHIEAIFQALDFGLDGITEMPGNSFKEVTNGEIPKDIDPDRFNRMDVVIDGEHYTVSVFRPQKEDTVLDLKRDHRMIGPEDEDGKAWAVQDGKLYGWSESNCRFEHVWWLDDEGNPRTDLPNQEHVNNLCKDRPFDPAWLKE